MNTELRATRDEPTKPLPDQPRRDLRLRRLIWACILIAMLGSFGFVVTGNIPGITVHNDFVNFGLALLGIFLPTLNAISRRHHNTGAIALLNLIASLGVFGFLLHGLIGPLCILLGCLFWIIALVWSATRVERGQAHP